MGEKIDQTPFGENVLEVESKKSARIKTLPQLLRAGKIDKKIWRVDHFVLNKWEVGAKDAEGQIQISELFQVKATLRRKKMISAVPTLRPLEVNRSMVTLRKTRYKKTAGVETVLILPDPHFGYRKLPNGQLESFHDMKALDVVLQISYDLKPDRIVFLGDTLDLPGFSRFVSSPDIEQLAQHAVIAANWWLGLMSDSSTGSARFLLGGNHDVRIETAILQNLKAAYGLRAADELDLPPALSVPKLLALHDLGINYEGMYPNSEHWLSEDLLCIHGNVARKGGGKTVSAVVKDHDVSVIQGHNHRLERVGRTLFNGSRTRTIGAYSLGCLCKITGEVPAKNRRNDWQNGFGIATITEGYGSTVQLYEITDGQCLFGGRVYRGEDRTSVLSEDSGWDFG
jgi:hypothetical protein